MQLTAPKVQGPQCSGLANQSACILLVTPLVRDEHVTPEPGSLQIC